MQIFQSEFTQKTFLFLLLSGAIRNQSGEDACHHLTFHLEICLTDCKWCVKLNLSLLHTALNSHETQLLLIYGSDPLIQGMIYPHLNINVQSQKVIQWQKATQLWQFKHQLTRILEYKVSECRSISVMKLKTSLYTHSFNWKGVFFLLYKC